MLADSGITSGLPGNLFKPNDNITRGQAAVWVLQYSYPDAVIGVWRIGWATNGGNSDTFPGTTADAIRVPKTVP